MEGMVTLTTERLVLREWRDEDAGPLYELASDAAVGPAAGWPQHRDERESMYIIQTVLRRPDSYAVTFKGDGSLVGAIAFKDHSSSDLVQGDSERELGYWIGRPYWGRGFATEAVRVMLAYGRDELCLSCIWAGHYAGNLASRRVMEKCGLSYVRTRAGVPVPLLGPDVLRDEDLLVLEFGS